MDEGNQWWTPNGITVLLGGLSAFLVAVFGKSMQTALRKSVDAYHRRREAREMRRALDEELSDKGHKYIIRRLDRQVTEQQNRISELEEKVSQLLSEHHECRAENALMRKENAMLLDRINKLESRQ